MTSGTLAKLRALGARRWVLVASTLAGMVELLGPSSQPLVVDVAGLWLILGAPLAVWYGCASRVVSTREAAALVALGFGLIADMLAILALNAVLPMLGDPRPLARIPMTATLAVAAIVLGALLPEADLDHFAEPWRIGRGELAAVGSAGLVCIILSVAGPVRINNGFSSRVSIVAMVCLTALVVALLARKSFSIGAVELGLYCAALSILLLTSLRGWAITGHDIQREYEYFELAFGGERWQVRTYSNAYNACLSVTLLPVALAKLTAIPGVFVFKAVLPVLFATTPVMLFRAVRNVAPQSIAVLSAAFYIMFPTFFSDMPYMGRQEVAFVLLGAAMLTVTERGWRLRDRRIGFLVLMAGVVLSHYSTAYIVVLVLGGAAASDLTWRAGTAARTRWRRSKSGGSHRMATAAATVERSVIVWWLVPAVALLAVLWAGPVTGTGGQLKTTITASIQELTGSGAKQAGSSATSYSIFGGATESDAQRLSDYRAATITETAPKRATGNYLPLSFVNQYPTPYQAASVLPLTSLGKRLQSLGISMSSMNGLLRSGIATLMQLLILLGLAATWLRRYRSFEPSRDQVTLTLGALVMLAALTVVPQLSVDYSVQRGFQQGIFFFGPFMAAGLVWALRWARRWTRIAACAAVAALLLDMSGVVPKVTGGYAAQLSLSNSGQYYDLYYPLVSEQQAAHWLAARIKASSGTGTSLVQTDDFTFAREQTILTGNVQGTIYPTQLDMYAYVFLGATTVKKDSVTISYRGNLVTYRYPMALLNAAYNEIYASDGAEIFQ